jgi:hypothetical protein
MREQKFTDEYVKYIFTEDEKRDIASEMARKVSELQSADDRKKAIASQIKSEMDALQAEVNFKAGLLNNGYEMRRVKCEMRPDWDNKEWLIIRQDTFDIVKTKRMTPDELQMRVDEEVV